MKKIVMTFGIVLFLLLSVGYVFAGSDYENQRYLVKSNNAILKMMYGVNHNFDKGFTTELTQGQLKILEKFGVEVEKVELYQITGKPVCGDGILNKGEQCELGNLEEYPCLEGYTCNKNCKCVEETAPPERAYYPSTQKPWGIVKVNGGLGGLYNENPIIVAVLDTGVYKDHLDLKANIIDCKDATRRGIRKGCADDNGHGTHVAGTILANGGNDGKGIFGVAPESELMAIKVCGKNGCLCDDIAAGIRYATDNGANIISMSLGGQEDTTFIKPAIDYAVGKGVLVVAAAGNYHSRYNPGNVIQYPGANPNVVAVAAFDSSDNIASFSSLGVNNNDWKIESREIEFAAPGVDVESTWKNGGYNTISGTSMATPHVAGIAAKDWQGSASTTRTYLQDLARAYTENINGIDYGLVGDDIKAGFGLPISPTTA